jgi:hypothetical protein
LLWEEAGRKGPAAKGYKGKREDYKGVG